MIDAICSRRVLLRDCDKLVIAPARIELAAGRIKAVVRADAPSAPAQQGRVIDLGDRLLTPAFVNAHTHLALAFLRGVDAARYQRNLVEDLYFTFESKLTPADVRAFARMGAYESLLAGVGCVWDHYYGGTALAEALRDTGLSGVVSPTLQDLAGPGAGDSERALAATFEIAVDAGLREAGVFAALGPHATDTVSPTLLAQVAELAERHGLPVHMHLAQSYDELARVSAREGVSPLGLLERAGMLARAPQLVLAHALFASTQDLRALDPSRHTLVYCPSSQQQFGFPAPVATWSALGAAWVVATDCASSNDSMNLQKELRLCHGAASATITGDAAYARFLAHGQLSDAAETWRTRSERVAEFAPAMGAACLLSRVFERPGALHPEFRAGAIESGALANLIAWDVDHPAFWPGTDVLRALALSDTTQAMHALFVCGKPIGEVGAVVQGVTASDAYREARREADERLAHLLR